jgi:hypothetical protein
MRKQIIRRISNDQAQPGVSIGRSARAMSTVTRINKALKAAGREERLVRGRGYYYLIEGEAHTWYSSSIYVCWLEHTERDFQFARNEINAMFERNGIKERI